MDFLKHFQQQSAPVANRLGYGDVEVILVEQRPEASHAGRFIGVDNVDGLEVSRIAARFRIALLADAGHEYVRQKFLTEKMGDILLERLRHIGIGTE